MTQKSNSYAGFISASRRSIKAFTLIELLVVVLIIGILAAIALPQYGKTVKKARAAQLDVIINTATKAVDMYLLENGLPDNSSGKVYLTGKNSVSPIAMPGNCSQDNNCYMDGWGLNLYCKSSFCRLSTEYYYSADGTYSPQNTWLSSKSTWLYLDKTSPGGKWEVSRLNNINKNSTDAEDKQAGEVICPIVEKYVAADDETFVANCK